MSSTLMKPDHQNQSARIESDPMKDPVFILGMHRSGTTLLYELMNSVEQWNTLCAWHVACYDEIRAGETTSQASRDGFSQRLRDAGMETRGVDSVKAGPDTKEEYCFIMDNKNLGSKVTPKGLSLFEEICATVQSTHPQARPLLLKNPWDFGNAHVIRELIPSAKFVYIHRDPVEAINSMYRFLQSVIFKPNPYMAMLSRRYEKMTKSRWKMSASANFIRRMPALFIEGLLLWYGSQCSGYLKSVDKIPEEQRVEVTYPQLCENPNATMAKILGHLGISDHGVDFAPMIKNRNPELDKPMTAKADKIRRRTRKYLKRIEQIPSPSEP